MYEITQMLRNGSFPTANKKFSKVVHVGHSFGAARTYRLSALHPDVTDGIVLTGWYANETWLAGTLADWNVRLARLNQPFRFGNASAATSRRSAAFRGGQGNNNVDTADTDLLYVVSSALAYIGIDLNSEES